MQLVDEVCRKGYGRSPRYGRLILDTQLCRAVLSKAGRSVLVSSMPLKGSGEARGKPPRSRAWLSNRMVNPSEVGFNLRGISPPARYLARWAGQWWEMDVRVVSHTMIAEPLIAVKRMAWAHLIYPMPTEARAVARMGCMVTTTYTVASSPST